MYQFSDLETTKNWKTKAENIKAKILSTNHDEAAGAPWNLDLEFWLKMINNFVAKWGMKYLHANIKDLNEESWENVNYFAWLMSLDDW